MLEMKLEPAACFNTMLWMGGGGELSASVQKKQQPLGLKI